MTLYRGLLLAALCLTATAHAAFETTRAVAPRSEAYDPLAPPALFWLANPATLVLAPAHFSAAYTRPFGLTQLETGSAGINLHRRPIAFGVGLTTLGQTGLYRESDLNVAAALRIRRGLSIGSALHLYDLRFGARYAPWLLTAGDIGIWYESQSGTGIGLSRTDQVITSPTSRTVVTPATRFALSYRYSPPLGLRAAASYRDRWVFTFGETLLIADRLHLHADLLTAPLRVIVGARIRIASGYLDLTHRSHPDLGSDTILEWGARF